MSDELAQKIDRLNLSETRYRFVLLGMSAKLANLIEEQYRRFLYLIGSYPDEEIIPWSEPLSEFWRAHVTDTARYEEDCLNLFGRIAHFHPSFTLDLARKEKQLARVRELYVEKFGAHKPRIEDEQNETPQPQTQRRIAAPIARAGFFPWMIGDIHSDFGPPPDDDPDDDNEESADYEHEQDIADDEEDDDDWDDGDAGDFDSGDGGDG